MLAIRAASQRLTGEAEPEPAQAKLQHELDGDLAKFTRRQKAPVGVHDLDFRSRDGLAGGRKGLDQGEGDSFHGVE